MGNKEYNPIGCEHKLPNGLSAWMFQAESSGSGPDIYYCVAYHVCNNCGEIRIAGYKWDGKSKHNDRFNEIIHIHHPDAIDAIIKQANFFNEDAKWCRADNYAALQAKCDKYEKALREVNGIIHSHYTFVIDGDPKMHEAVGVIEKSLNEALSGEGEKEVGDA